MKELEKILNKIVDFFIKLFNKIYNNTIKYYNKLLFDFNKQNTIKKMYEPSINRRLDEHKLLIETLNSLKSEEQKLNTSIKKYTSNINILEEKTIYMQDFLNNN